MTGPSKDRLTPRITTTAKLLWGVYIFISIRRLSYYILLVKWVGSMLFVIHSLQFQQEVFRPDQKA